MAETRFDAEKFQEMQKEATRLQEQAKVELDAITTCIQGMEGASDSITQAMYQIGSDFAPKFESLISSVEKLLEAFSEVYKKLKDLASDAIEGLKNAAMNFIGGTSVNVQID